MTSVKMLTKMIRVTMDDSSNGSLMITMMRDACSDTDGSERVPWDGWD